MQTDLFGKARYKINLHTHTTRSDGKKKPEEALQCYRNADYDAVALTDHWYYAKEDNFDGMTVLSGGEYNIGGNDSRNGVFHIVGFGMTREPSVTLSMSAQQIIDAIHAAGGLVDLAHPAWSLNTPEQILPLKNIDTTEIYNTISGMYFSRRPDSSLIVDMLATAGRVYPLIAADDTHRYLGEECVSWIMAEAESRSREDLLDAIKHGRFYATQGPEIHLFQDGDEYVVRSSPVSEITFFSNLAFAPRTFMKEGITEARYKPRNDEFFLRAAVTDRNGKRAWTNIIAF